ncbi:MAG TPA: hypothetical protein ENG48_02735 [Candidatus Atribacteria bacterium]|nr:hypothetical protein [Candidatus Atribacteria bacterium]
MKCAICNKILNTKRSLINHIKIHNISAEKYYINYLGLKGLCLICKKPTRFISLIKGYKEYCSNSCALRSQKSRQRYQQTCLKKYGVSHISQSPIIKQKRRETCLKRYNTPCALQSLSAKNKTKETCLRKYGTESSNQSEEVKQKKINSFIAHFGVACNFQANVTKEKIKNTCTNLYGTPYFLQSEYAKKKIKETCLKKYGVENPGQSEEVKQKKLKTHLSNFLPIVKNILKKLDLTLVEDYTGARNDLEVICNLCGTRFSTVYFNIYQGCGRCPKCYPSATSIGEQNLKEFIKKLGFRIEKNNKTIIYPYELDIYIPEKKIAIEYNGLYWHSDIFKDKLYHLNKLKLCNEKGIRLVQIFEDEWLIKQDIVKARLRQILNVSNAKRVHARQCFIKEISARVKNEFLEKYHLQGKDSSTVKLGAFYDGKLVATMTFSKGSIAKGSKFKEKVWELNRFCSNYDYHIPGIASKLLIYFKRNYEWTEIFSYADRRWSIGNLYYKLGFELEKETRPNYWYIKSMQRIHRFSLRKRLDEPKDVPESILRAKEGYMRIWDCGHLKFNIIKGII